MSIKEDFHKAQWKHYRDNSLNIGRTNSHPFDIYAFKNGEKNDLKTFFSETEFINFIHTRSTYTISIKNDDNLKDFAFDFFIEYYKKSSSIIKKELLEKFDFYSGKSINFNYQKFCDEIVNSNEERLVLLKSFPITTFKVYSFDFGQLCHYLSSHKIEDKVIDSFLLDFLKVRKNQIKQSPCGLEIKQFLQEKYELPQLKKYFPFFNLLKADYEEVDINVFENNHVYTTCSFVNIKSLIQKFAIKQWSSMEYTMRLDTLCEGLIKYYHLNNFAVEDVDKMKQIVKVSLFHNENNFNLELLNTTILEYFHFLKANPETISSTENAEKWILQKNLDKELNKDSLDTTVKKIKI